MNNNDDDRIVYNVYMIDVLLGSENISINYWRSFTNEDAVKYYVAAMNEFPYMKYTFYKAEKLSDCNNIAIKFCEDEHLFINRKKPLYEVYIINIAFNENLVINRISRMNMHKKIVEVIEDTALIFSIESGATEKEISDKALALLNSNAEYFPKIKDFIIEYTNVMELKVLK